MKSKSPLQPLKHLFAKLFHARSIIIISQRRTNHISLSGPLQFCAIAGLITCIVWASYSTGRYVATSNKLEQRDETIRSVANSRIDTNFGYTVAGDVPRALGPVNPLSMPLTDPTYTLSAVNSSRLFARIALLENRVRELKDVNSEIIQTVREKTNAKLINMEEIIRQTGLNPDALREEAAKQMQKQRESGISPVTGKPLAEGGPFIPVDTSGNGADSVLSPDLQQKLENLALLNTIIQTLPLGVPLPGAELHSNFGRRVDPFTGQLAFHAGVDLAGPYGAPIHVTGNGKVIAAGPMGAYGNAVDVEHGFGLVTRYGHMSKIGVTVGQVVKTGQVVGFEGSTGRSTGPHVHYEVRYNDRPVNPINFLHAAADVSQTQ